MPGIPGFRDPGINSLVVRSVTLNLANKFSQCSFSVAEHCYLFSDLIIIRQAKRDGVDHMTYTAPTVSNRQRNCCRKSSTLPHRPEINLPHHNLYASYHDIRDDNSVSTATSNPSEQPTPSLQNCHAHSLKAAKHFCLFSVL